MTDEKWKNFPMIDGRSFSKYEVSSLGRRRNKKTGYIFSSNPTSSGYVCNQFCDDDKGKPKLMAHNIVARAFNGDPDSDDLTVDHINRDPTDNRLDNLRWATKKQQTANSDRSNCKSKGQPVVQYTMDMEEIKTWTNITLAAKEFGIAGTNIGKVCRGLRNHAGWYKWAYERQNLDGEIWKESLKPLGIQVSNMGRIKPQHCHIVYGSKAADGYLKYGKPAKFVHVMVAETFLPNPEKKPEVNHKDLNRANNKLENLEWATKSEQAIHSHKNSKPTRYSNSRAVKQYDLEGNFIREYRSVSEASRKIGCSESGISHASSGVLKSIKGYIFKYTNEDALNRPTMKYSRKIDLIDKKGNIIKTYDSVRSASLDMGTSDSSIFVNLRGATKKTKDGYIFRYH